ncbi:Protein RESTRICTED TEV MOVEMENT 2 [Linum grandiflorum]
MAPLRGEDVMPERAPSRDHLVEELVPSSAWDDDIHAHFLLIDLPGFRKEEVSLQVDSGEKQIIVTGKRLLSHNKYVYFHQTYRLPSGISETDNIVGKFDGEILYVTVPKHQVSTAERSPDGAVASNSSGISGSHVAEFGKADLEKWEHCGELGSVMSRAIGTIRKHKGIATVAVIAFTLGVLLSPKLITTPAPEKYK